MKKMVKFLERSTLVSQGKNKNGMKKRRWKKWNKEKDENENTWFITYGIKCSAEAEKKEKIYTRRQPSLVNFYKGTLKISEDLFQAQQSDPRVPKIKKKKGSLYIPHEPWWSNPQIKQSSPKWGQKKKCFDSSGPYRTAIVSTRCDVLHLFALCWAAGSIPRFS
jgi:hypothetical protein